MGWCRTGLGHPTASVAIGAGTSVVVVQRTLGHATAPTTLDAYRHLLDDDLTGGGGRVWRGR
jgi:integrase